MSENFVVFTRPGAKNFIIPFKQVENNTITQLIDKILQQNPISFVKNNEIIMIKTPLFREALKSDCNPFKTYPDLVLSQKPDIYQRPQQYLLICPKAEANIKFFYLSSVVQDDIELPPWEVDINISNFNFKPASALFQYLIGKFPYETDKKVAKSIVDDKKQNIPDNKKASDLLKEMCLKQYSIKCSLSENELKKVNYRSQIVNEIQKSEEVYISQLTIIKDVIIPQFKKNKILLDEDYRKFDIIANMIIVHSQFLSNLESAGNSFAANLAPIFINFSDYFKIVKPYVKNLDSIYEMMSRADKNKIDQIIKSEPCMNNIAPMSYFIVPFQRIPKYPLFLRDLINNTPKFHPDSIFLNLALEMIKNVMNDIEYSKESAEDQQKLYEIFMRTSKKVNLLDPRRRLIDQITAKLKTNGTKAIFYVFNDMVMLTSMKKNDEVVVFHSKIGDFCYLEQFAELTITFHLNDNTNGICVVEFESAADKEKFVDYVEKFRGEQYKELERDKVFSIERVSDKKLDHLCIPVYGHETVSLKKWNAIFTFGGSVLNEGCKNINSFFTPSTKEFKMIITQEGPTPRIEHALAMNDDTATVYLFGGRNGNDFYNDLYAGTISAKKEIVWKKIVVENSEIEPEPRAGHSMVYNKDELIIFGGYLKDKAFNDVLIFNVKENKWNRVKGEVTNAPSPRFQHSVVKCGPWMIVHAGRSSQVYNDTYLFDMQEKKWLTAKITGETAARFGHESFFLNGYVVFIGGTDDRKDIVQPSVINTLKDKEWCYEEFRMIGNKPPSLFLFGLAMLNSSQLFAYGGIDPTTVETVSNSFYSIKVPAALKVVSNKVPVPLFIEADQPISVKRKNTLSFFNFLKGKKDKDENVEGAPNTNSTMHRSNSTVEINYDLLLGQIKVDPSKLLPFQKKALEKYLFSYNAILTDNNNILMCISEKFMKMKKKIKIPVCDIFVKVYDKLDAKIFIIKISSTTPFEQFLALLTEKMKNRSEYSVTIMKYYPLAPDFYDVNIYNVIRYRLSHLNVYVS